jgi:hypothetical protein
MAVLHDNWQRRYHHCQAMEEASQQTNGTYSIVLLKNYYMQIYALYFNNRLQQVGLTICPFCEEELPKWSDLIDNQILIE